MGRPSKYELAFPQDFQKAHFASEIACDLGELDDILFRHQITREHLSLLTTQTEFNKMLEEFQREWASPMNVKERIRLKAALAAEDGLEDMYMIFKDGSMAPAARMEAYKQIVTLSDTAPKRDVNESGGNGFSITINVGKNTGESPANALVIEGEAAAEVVISAPVDE
jgi:hypothetical protein